MKGGRKPAGPEDRNRGISDGFFAFMLDNPVYFEELAHMMNTPDNIRVFWRGLRRDGLVAAAYPPPQGCRCRFCASEKPPSRGRIDEEEM